MSPTFSIITPVFDPPLAVLQAMLESVRAQTDPSWEHCLVDDGSTRPGVVAALEAAAAADPRVKVRLRPERGGIVAASTDALELATGAFVALLDHDDELEPRALAVMADHIDRHDDADVLYSDEDKIDLEGRRSDVFVKPGWSPDRLVGQMYISHLSVLRRSLVDEVGGFRASFDGAQDWDLMLRATERARRVVHVPDVLYHWRTIEGSSAADPEAKPWAHDASGRAVNDFLERTGVEAVATAVPGYGGQYWLKPQLRSTPLVSVIIPTAGRSGDIDGTQMPLVVNCVRTLLGRSTYENLEIVVVIDDHAPADVRGQLLEAGGSRLRLVEFTEPFNFSRKINVGVAASTGELVLVFNDDVEVLAPGWRPSPSDVPAPLPTWPTVEDGTRRTWIESMLVYAKQPGVGCVGAKLFYPNGRLQHAGVIARNGFVTHSYHNGPGNSCGYWGNLLAPTNHLAVTAACLMVRRTLLDEVGGFDEALPLNYNDVDLCLRVRASGHRNVLVPHVELLHRESSSRGVAPAKPEEIAALQERWGDLLWNDPYYDTRFVDNDFNLSRSRTPAALARRVRTAYREGGATAIASALRRRVSRGGDG